MACSAITAGVLNGCSDNQGGLEAIFIANGAVENFEYSKDILKRRY